MRTLNKKISTKTLRTEGKASRDKQSDHDSLGVKTCASRVMKRFVNHEEVHLVKESITSAQEIPASGEDTQQESSLVEYKELSSKDVESTTFTGVYLLDKVTCLPDYEILHGKMLQSLEQEIFKIKWSIYRSFHRVFNLSNSSPLQDTPSESRRLRLSKYEDSLLENTITLGYKHFSAVSSKTLLSFLALPIRDVYSINFIGVSYFHLNPPLKKRLENGLPALFESSFRRNLISSFSSSGIRSLFLGQEIKLVSLFNHEKQELQSLPVDDSNEELSPYGPAPTDELGDLSVKLELRVDVDGISERSRIQYELDLLRNLCLSSLEAAFDENNDSVSSLEAKGEGAREGGRIYEVEVNAYQRSKLVGKPCRVINLPAQPHKASAKSHGAEAAAQVSTDQKARERKAKRSKMPFLSIPSGSRLHDEQASPSAAHLAESDSVKRKVRREFVRVEPENLLKTDSGKKRDFN
jgi:hypothetical protein